MVRKLIMVVFLCSLLFGKNYYKQYLNDFKKLDRSQLEFMMEINKRAKPYNLSYSMIAIAWQESNLGKWNINLSDPSCGPFHQSIVIFLKRHEIKNTDFNRNRYCMDLINNVDLSVSTAIAELEAWLAIHHKRWNKFEYAYRSYNAGYNYNSNVSKEYASKIQARIKVLKFYQSKYNILGDMGE